MKEHPRHDGSLVGGDWRVFLHRTRPLYVHVGLTTIEQATPAGELAYCVDGPSAAFWNSSMSHVLPALQMEGRLRQIPSWRAQNADETKLFFGPFVLRERQSEYNSVRTELNGWHNNGATRHLSHHLCAALFLYNDFS
jgi:hypothetical protein